MKMWGRTWNGPSGLGGALPTAGLAILGCAASTSLGMHWGFEPLTLALSPHPHPSP